MNKRKELFLGVNIDHVATLRQARGTNYPRPVDAALLAEDAGADSITVHLREDRRHIQEADLVAIKNVMKTHMNLEMALTEEMLEIAASIQPSDICIVPEKRQELTTEGGLDVESQLDKITSASKLLANLNIRVSLFIDPEKNQIDAALATGVPVIELHTGAYANTTGRDQMVELNRIIDAVSYAHKYGLIINAGHGLHYQNVQPIAQIKDINELNIGHSIIARSIFDGISSAVVEMKRLIKESRLG